MDLIFRRKREEDMRRNNTATELSLRLEALQCVVRLGAEREVLNEV